jgi:Tfp pilus assembly protein PilN
MHSPIPQVDGKKYTMNTYVALNISNSSLRVLSARGRQVKKWGSQALETGLVRDGIIQQPKAVAEAIDLLFKSANIPKERVIFSLSGLPSTYRFISLPRMKPALIEEAIVRATKTEISLPLDELYLSWAPVPGKADEQTYFVLGTPRGAVDTIIQTLGMAGIEPYVMDLRLLALARAANRSDAIIANLEPDGFDIVFVNSGLPKVLHTVNPRGEGATLEDNIRRLSDELSKATVFYQNNNPENRMSPDTPLLLTGELAAEPATIGIVKSLVQYPVELMEPALDLPPDLPANLYTGNIGLILKKVPQKAAPKGEKQRFHDIDINILSGKYRKRETRRSSPGALFFGLLIVIALALLYLAYDTTGQLKAENLELDNELREVSRQLNLYYIISEQAALKEEMILGISENITIIEEEQQDLLKSQGVYSSYLELVNGALPPRAYFTSVNIDDDQIIITGESDSVFTVVEYAQALEKYDVFPEVRITMLDDVDEVTTEDAVDEPVRAEDIKTIFGILINLY